VTDRSLGRFSQYALHQADASDALRRLGWEDVACPWAHEMVGAERTTGPRVERWHRWEAASKIQAEPLNVLGHSPARWILAACGGFARTLVGEV
jgi:hypothetical protein